MTRKLKNSQNPVEALLNPPHISKLCGAHARSTGEPCKRFASIGFTRCLFHGGAKGSGRPITHGRRSVQAQRTGVVMGALLRMIKQSHKKPDPVEV